MSRPSYVRRHANGITAWLRTTETGYLVATWPTDPTPETPLPSTNQLQELGGSLDEAQRRADELAHPKCAGTACGPWVPGRAV